MVHSFGVAPARSCEPWMIAVEQHAEGSILPVKAQAGGRQNALRGEHDGLLRVSVTQAPEKGKANRAIIEVLSESLGLRKQQIELIAGETASLKRFLIRGIAPAELATRVQRALQADEAD